MAAVRKRRNAAHKRDKNENDKTSIAFLQNESLLCEASRGQVPPRYGFLNAREFLETSLRDDFTDVNIPF